MKDWRQWLSIGVGAVVLLWGGHATQGVGAIVASLLTAGVLALVMSRSTASGVGLVVMVAGLFFVTTALVNIPEGVLFDVMAPADAPVALLMSLVTAVVTVTLMAAVAGRLGATESEPVAASAHRGPGLAWRLAATPAVFVLSYFVAGMLVYPYVEPYYASLVMPDLAAIASMQVLRALALVGAAYAVLRTLRSRRDAVLVLAVAFPVLGAVAPLLPANALMPAQVRLAHGLEMAPYYAFFGWLVAVWFGPPRRPDAEQAVVAEAAPAVS